MLIQFQDVKPQKDEIFVPTLDYITKELYDSFVNVLFAYQCQRCNHSTHNLAYDIHLNHQFFAKQPSETDRLL